MSTTKEDSTLSKVPKIVIELAGKYREQMKITPTGVIEAAPDIYEKNLPEGVTMDMVKKIQDHDRHAVAATRLATGEIAIPFLEENPKIDQVSVEFDGGKNHFGETFHRKHEVADGKGGVDITYGHSVSYFEASADSSKTALKAVSVHLNKMAAKALGK
jgi:hypothetical protein